MTRYLFDTNHIGTFFKPELILDAKLRAHPDDEFGLSTSTVAELWYMVFNSQRQAGNRSRLADLLALYRYWPFDENAAERFGEIKTILKRAGTTVADVDLQIAAVALVNGLTLLTADRAFLRVPDLRVENWL